MGKHWQSGRDKESAGPCVVALRALAAGAAVAATLTAVGSPGAPPMQPGAATAPVEAAGAGQPGLPGLTGGFPTDSRALVPFSRTMVRAIAKDGRAPLKVASARLKRPPEGSLMAPLETLISSSRFGYRVSPLTGTVGDFHLGQDFAAACGARVYSADSGVVRAAGWHPWGGGNRVEIDHGNGLITTYNHLEAIAVSAGDSVEVGQVIAKVGTTGWSTGCHLHFETILNGRHTNPLDWTLLPISQLDELENIAMVSYDGRDRDAVGVQRWAIPVAADNRHAVLGGDAELSGAPIPDDTFPPASLEQSEPTQAPPSNPTTTTPTATEAPTATPTDTAPPTATTTPAATEAPTATPTDTAAPTATSTEASTAPSATESPSPATETAAAGPAPEPAPEATTESSTAPMPSTEPATDPTPTDAATSTATEPSPSGTLTENSQASPISLVAGDESPA